MIAFFDIKLIMLANANNNNVNKFIIAGIIGMLIYQQVQNIGMTIGLLPITGITQDVTTIASNFLSKFSLRIFASEVRVIL